MNPSTIHHIGAIGGAAIGVLCGVIGTYFSIKNAKTPAERRFGVKYVISVWVAVSLLMGLLALSFISVILWRIYWVAFAVFFILLGPSIFWANKRQALLRREKKRWK